MLNTMGNWSFELKWKLEYRSLSQKTAEWQSGFNRAQQAENARKSFPNSRVTASFSAGAHPFALASPLS